MGGVAAIIGMRARKKSVVNMMIHSITHRGGGSHCICCSDKLATIAQSPHFEFHINIPEKYKGLFVALDGQIDNYQEILGNEFLDFSFAERDHLAIFEAYRKWGNEFPSKLRGNFAFILYDNNKQSVIAVRDHFGIKPMYYSRQKNVVYFGSELKSLLVTLENNVPNYSVLLKQYATSACENLRETVFMGIQQLLPGEQLVTDGDNIKIQKYYELQNHVKVDDNLSEQESNERFFELFTDIVYRSVERENKVGLFFSGGIDSSSLAAAANFKKMNLHAYIGVSDDNEPEEIKIIKGMLNEIGVDYSFVETIKKNMFDEIKKLMYHLEMPFPVSTMGYESLYKKAKSDGVSKIFHGQSGGMVQMGGKMHYSYYLLDLLLSGNFSEFITSYKKWGKSHKQIAMALLKLFLNYRNISFNRSAHKTINDVFCIPYSPTRDRNQAHHFPTGLENITSAAIASEQPRKLRILDRHSGKHGVEVKIPYSELQLVELIWSIPTRFKIKDGKQKILVEKSMGHIIPEYPFKAKKNSYLQSMLSKDSKAPLREDFKEILNSQSAKERGIYSRQFLKDIKNGTAKPNDIMKAGQVELWHQVFIS